MKYLVRSQCRDLISRPLVLIALLVNLVLALFAIIVVHVASHTIVHELAQSQPQTGYQYVVPITDNRESTYFTLRKRWRDGELPGIVGMVPVIEGSLEIAGRAIPLIGIDLVSDLHATTNVRDAGTPTQLLTQDSVIAFGDDLENILFPDQIQVLEFHTGAQTFLLADIATAQNLLKRTGEIDVAWLRYDQAAVLEWLEHISPGVSAGFGINQPEISFSDFDVEPMELWLPTQAFSGSIAFNMGLLGMLVALVSGFIVFESTTRSVVRRSQEFDRLQTIGVPVLQIRCVLMLEAALLVLFSTIVAVILAHVFLQQSNLIRPVPTATFLIATVKGLLLGLSTAMIGVILAFVRKARRVTPILLVLVVVLSLTMFSFGIWITTTLAGAYIAIFALCLLHIVVLTPIVVRLLGFLVSRFMPVSLMSRINMRAIWQNLKQANVAVIAFSLAIATAIGISVMIGSLRSDFFTLLDARLPPGIQVRPAGNAKPDVIQQWPSVEEVREYYGGQGTLSIGKVDVVATSLDAYEARRYGYAFEADRVGVYVNEKVASQLQLQVGDDLKITLSGLNPLSLPISHIFKSYGEVSRVVIVPIDQIPTHQLVRDRLLIVAQPDSYTEIEQELRDTFPNTKISNHQEIHNQAVAIFNRTFALTNLIALIAVMVAIIGLFSSALAIESAKGAEYRLLNTLGFSRFSLFRQSFTQALLIGIVVCLLSVPLGIATAWILCELVNPRAFQWTISMHIAPTTLGYPLLLGLCAAVLASVLPWFMTRRTSQ